MSNEPWRESIYRELHQIATAQLARERDAESIQPTLLANDAYLKLMEQRNIDPNDRSVAMAAAATIIRRLLVDSARQRRALKRGGKNKRISLQGSDLADAKQIDVLELHDALNVLAEKDGRAAEVVELKFFGGLTAAEIATQLGVSERTVHGDWSFAKAWLHRELKTSESCSD